MCCYNSIKIEWYSFIIISHTFCILCFVLLFFSFFSRKYLFRIISIVNILFFKVFLNWIVMLSTFDDEWVYQVYSCFIQSVNRMSVRLLRYFKIILYISRNIHRFERCLIDFKQSFRWSRRTLSIEKEEITNFFCVFCFLYTWESGWLPNSAVRKGYLLISLVFAFFNFWLIFLISNLNFKFIYACICTQINTIYVN